MRDGSLTSGASHATAAVSPGAGTRAISTVFPVILSLSFCHLLDDVMQSLVPALFLLLLGLLTAFLPRRPGAPSIARP